MTHQKPGRGDCLVKDGLSGAGHERPSSLVVLRGGNGRGDTPGTTVVVQLSCAGCIGDQGEAIGAMELDSGVLNSWCLRRDVIGASTDRRRGKLQFGVI